ncbi:MAG: TonB-dependent receptor, partial [Myxococcales bacterium]|nr:TonB-dependent receptor [Myxococcales bacterium]
MTAKRYISVLVCLLALASVARADSDGETIVIVGHASDPDDAPAARDRDRALGDAPFVTIIHADDHPATASVADAIGSTVGAQTRSLGGLGAYESVTVRGAAPGHTVVLIDGVPLARIAAVTTDLGRFALDAFGEVELYRGGVPIELGGAGVGGALNLVTRLGRGERGERFRISIGSGSFGARHLRFHYGDSHFGGRLLSATTIGYQGATGEYTYFNDGGTPLNPNDDSYQARRNNGFDQIDAASRIGATDRSAAGGLRIAWKHQGLPGSMAQPAIAASLATLDVIADARGDLAVGPVIARELGYALVELQQLRDPMAELGLGAQDRDYRTLSGGASSTWIAALGRHRGTAGLEIRADHFRDSDRTGTRSALAGSRIGGAVLGAFDLALDRAQTIVVTPAVRLEAVRTEPTPMTLGPGALVAIPARWDAIPSPRLTARAAVRDD